jgi:hypothetical protein
MLAPLSDRTSELPGLGALSLKLSATRMLDEQANSSPMQSADTEVHTGAYVNQQMETCSEEACSPKAMPCAAAVNEDPHRCDPLVPSTA